MVTLQHGAAEGGYSMNLDRTFARDIKKQANGDGSLEAKVTFKNRLKNRKGTLNHEGGRGFQRLLEKLRACPGCNMRNRNNY